METEHLMASVPAEHADLCGAPHFGHIVTVNRDGSPQSSPVWIIPARVADDGSVEAIRFSTGLKFRKVLNMQREPRVSLTVHDLNNPYRVLEVVGTASLTPRNGWSDVDEISHTYLGTDYPYKEGSGEGWQVTIEIERVVVPHEFPLPSMVRPESAGSDLLNPPHFAHVATVSSKGQPRSSVVWHRRAVDGGADDIEFYTSSTALKARHLRNNPAVSVSIHDEANGGRYTELRGTAEIVDVEHHGLLDELTPRYWELDKYPTESDEPMPGVIVRVRTNKRITFGE